MSGGFANPIVGGGGGLVYPSIHSPNYIAGVSGWTVNKDGSAEFNNLGIRGTFTGTDFVINTDGAFFYQGTPGVGTLTLAITNASASGVDQYGNLYQPGGISIIALAGLANMLNLSNSAGDTLVNIDSAGNISAASISVDTALVGGADIINDVIDPMPQGVVNRGWTPSGAWPSAGILSINGDTAILELDQVLLTGRKYLVSVYPADFLLTNAPAAPTQVVHRLRFTSDGSTPTTASAEVTGHSPLVQEIPLANLLNFTSPYLEWIPPVQVADTLYRFLVTASIQSGGYKYQTILEMRIEDLGADLGQFGNNGTALGTGGTGGGGAQTFTKTYFATGSRSYYGSQANVNPNGRRSSNSSMYQGAYSGGLSVNGDQYSFALFNGSAISSDLSGATINSVKLRLTNLHSWYNSGMTAIIGYGTAASYGDPFVPGAGTHFNQTNYFISEGATLTKDITGAGIGTAFQSGGATAIAIGRSADRTTAGDLNNYGYFFGFSASDHTHCPALIINYTK